MQIKSKAGLCLVLLIFELIIFRDYVAPFQWGQLKVSGLACTCPDETVVNGRLYLRSITPDSLKKYNLDYSEIYVTERPSTSFDPMGTDNYIIKGKVIGKRRVYEGDSWNPLFEVQEWKELDILFELFLKSLVLLMLFLILYW